MGDIENPLIKLQDLARFLEGGSFDDNMQQLAAMAAKILKAENCSLMLLNEGEQENLRMRVCASFGSLPAAACKESTGQALLIEDIRQSEFAPWARRVNDRRKSLISSPIIINGSIVGMINISGQAQGRAFNRDDLSLLEVVGLFVGKAIQVVQLQNILNSRFVHMALLQSAKKALGSTLASAIQNPDQLARIVAKSFYKEMPLQASARGRSSTSALKSLSN